MHIHCVWSKLNFWLKLAGHLILSRQNLGLIPTSISREFSWWMGETNLPTYSSQVDGECIDIIKLESQQPLTLDSRQIFKVKR